MGKFETASVNDESVVKKIGQNLPAILRKEVAPLELMLEDQLLHRSYQNGVPTLLSKRITGGPN
jgi:hypothetical protein